MTLYEWVELDNTIKLLQERIKTYRRRKEEIEQSLISQSLYENGGEVQYNLDDTIVSLTKQTVVEPFTHNQLKFLMKKYREDGGNFDIDSLLDYLEKNNQKQEVYRLLHSNIENT